MRKLSEYRDEEALDLLADIIEPISELTADEDFKNVFGGEEKKKFSAKDMFMAIRIACKKHKAAVMTILAALEGVPVEEYHCNVFTVPLRFFELITDKDMLSVFTSQVREMNLSPSSGPATENTGDEED